MTEYSKQQEKIPLKTRLQQAWEKVRYGHPKNRQSFIKALQQISWLDHITKATIEGALKVRSQHVRDIMIPRAHMVSIQHDQSLASILPVIEESAHSRFPVLSDEREEVIGVLLAKDLLRYIGNDTQVFNLRDLLRPAMIVPESKRLHSLLKEFQRNQQHMAIVVDEYGAIAGLITIEDILEEIVGEIEDEHDIVEDSDIKQQGRNLYAMPALTSIEAFNEYFGANFSDAEYDTIGGLVLNQFKRLPKKGESTQIGPYYFTVAKADSRRIVSLEMRVKK